jgi:serine/threonine-protein kinase RsbW
MSRLTRTQAAPACTAMEFEHVYPGTISQARRVRADLAVLAAGCPMTDELILLASELAANAAVHSMSGWPDGEFIVRACLALGDYAWVEVEDQGGPWRNPAHTDRPHGLDIVAALAGEGNWGIDGGLGGRVVWVRLDWPSAGGSDV